MSAIIEMGVIEPQAAIGPNRTVEGHVTLGRLTTTEEQRMEALHKIAEHMQRNANRGRTVRATVKWTRGEPTVLEVEFATEHIEGKRVYLADKITEYTTQGAEIQPNEQARLRTLQAESLELHEKGML